MTYNVFGGTLNLAQSINRHQIYCSRWTNALKRGSPCQQRKFSKILPISYSATSWNLETAHAG